VSPQPSTASTSTTTTTPEPTSRPMRTSGYVKIPAPDIDLCQGCGASNHGKAIALWRVADERGPHVECDGCGASW
jgi:hypothetical protein